MTKRPNVQKRIEEFSTPKKKKKPAKKVSVYQIRDEISKDFRKTRL